MRRVTGFLICAIIMVGLVGFSYDKPEKVDIEDSLIRFHVVANSDLKNDQDIKLMVRDAVLKNVGGKLEKSGSREESLKILEKELPLIERTANEILEKHGFTYGAKAYLGKFQFPVKTYSNITLPAGEYTALRIVLGNGNGKNWWCVMFPPLCFIDITRGLTDEETEARLSSVMNESAVESITTNNKVVAKASSRRSKSSGKTEKSSANKGKASTPVIEFRFKSLDTIKQAFDRIRIMIADNL